jgi:hypothetical protein
VGGQRELREEMRAGFAAIEGRFAVVESNFAVVNSNFAEVEGKFAVVNSGLPQIIAARRPARRIVTGRRPILSRCRTRGTWNAGWNAWNS